jgi:hypothetical protein
LSVVDFSHSENDDREVVTSRWWRHVSQSPGVIPLGNVAGSSHQHPARLCAAVPLCWKFLELDLTEKN